MALGSWPQWLKVLLNICSLPGVPPLLEHEISINSPAPHGDVRLPGCSAKTLKMQLFQSTIKQQMGLGGSPAMPSSLGSPCSACAMPSLVALSRRGETGSGPPSFEVLGHHSALRRSGARTVPGRALGLYHHLVTAIAQNVPRCGSLPLRLPQGLYSLLPSHLHYFCIHSADSLTQQRMPCPSCPPGLPLQAPKGAVALPNLRTQGPG